MSGTVKRIAWAEVMAGLTGARLALFDDLIRRGMLNTWDKETGRWLIYSRFAYVDEIDNSLRPRAIAAAQKLWEFDGPCLLAALPETPRPVVAETMDAAPLAPAADEPKQVHRMTPQLSLF